MMRVAKSKNPSIDDPKGTTWTLTGYLSELAEKPKDMDKFKIIISVNGATERFDYSSGTGNRVLPNGKHLQYKATVRDLETSIPRMPDVKDLLICLARDHETLLDLPMGDDAALDHLQDEFSYTRASEAMRILRSLRENYDKVGRLLQSAKLNEDEFLAWCAELDGSN